MMGSFAYWFGFALFWVCVWLVVDWFVDEWRGNP